jgi:diguanylate cyclase
VELLEWVCNHYPRVVRLLMTGYADYESAVGAINRGQVYYFLSKPWRNEELQYILRIAADKFRMEIEQENLLAELRRLNQELEKRVADRTGELAQANQLLQVRTGELEEVNRQLEQRNHELETLALKDTLTGLLNRGAIESAANQEILRRARYRGSLAIGLLDVDHFKFINDQYLHTAGDFVLANLSRLLTGVLRKVDNIGRIGGEEFLVVAPETSFEGASALAERLRTTVESTPFYFKGTSISVTISAGFAVVENGIVTDFALLKEMASQALHEAKVQGRNRSVILDAGRVGSQVSA